MEKMHRMSLPDSDYKLLLIMANEDKRTAPEELAYLIEDCATPEQLECIKSDGATA